MSLSLENLGELRQTFRPKLANICAGIILGLGFVLGGISVALHLAEKEPERDTKDRIAKYALIAALGAGAPLGGLALLLWMKRLIFHRVSVFEKGFSYVYRGATNIVPWSEVAKINEVLTQEQLRVLKVPGGVLTNLDVSFIVHRKDGMQFRFTVNSIDDIPKLAGALYEAHTNHSIPWERIEQ